MLRAEACRRSGLAQLENSRWSKREIRLGGRVGLGMKVTSASSEAGGGQEAWGWFESIFLLKWGVHRRGQS